jgi:hypothetical protein
MSRPALMLILLSLSPSLAAAKPWNGIHPGASSTLDVVGKFGEPSRKVTEKGMEIWVYSGPKAITGTVQAQFKCDAATHVVQRIDVFPAPVISAEAVEQSYGPQCQPLKHLDPCYEPRQPAAGHRYFLYAKLGLAVFFKDDGKTVQSFAFLPQASP